MIKTIKGNKKKLVSITTNGVEVLVHNLTDGTFQIPPNVGNLKLVYSYVKVDECDPTFGHAVRLLDDGFIIGKYVNGKCVEGERYTTNGTLVRVFG